MKRILAMLLCAVLLTGCKGTAIPTDPAQENVLEIQYDWMAGESPVSPERTSEYRNAIDQLQNGFEVTETGCYWMCDGILRYSGHGSDEVVRLCGRPDCAHTGNACNAHFFNGMNVCYYIDKADLGSCNIELHKLSLPEDIEQILDEEGSVQIPMGNDRRRILRLLSGGEGLGQFPNRPDPLYDPLVHLQHCTGILCCRTGSGRRVCLHRHPAQRPVRHAALR